MGNNMVPGMLRPLVRLTVDEDLQRFDYFGCAIAAQTPILVFGGKSDTQAGEATIRAFAARLQDAGANVSLLLTPGGHGDALYTQEAGQAVSAFVAATSRR